MCGIVGRWHRDGSPIRLEEVAAAATRIRHRGPDDEGYLVGSVAAGRVVLASGIDTDPALQLTPLAQLAQQPWDLALGFRRLSILDLSSAGHQPMGSEDRRQWIVFNGEVYNYRELRQELVALGHSFRSGTDTEVILAAYREWGRECLERFNGMWALAIWDVERRTLFLARDRFGVKPLYFVDHGRSFGFGSEIKALVGPHGVPFAPEPGAVYDYLVHGHLPSSRGCETFFHDVQQVPPGHHLTVTESALSLQRYYELPIQPVRTEDPEAVATEYRELLTDAVRLRLRADVTVGSCLSGGVDSSSIVCLANGMLRAGGDAAPIAQRQKTISAVYDGDSRIKERQHIETVVAATGSDAWFVVPTAEWLRHDVERLIWHQDEPFTSTSIFAQWCVMSRVREAGVTVLLDGQGADEALAGYRPYDIALADFLRRGRIATAVRRAAAFRRVTGESIARQFARALAFQIPPRMQRRFRQRRASRRADSILRRDFLEAHRNRSVPMSERRDLQRHLWEMTVDESLPHLLRFEDRNSMAFHVEARVPFVDYRLVEFAFLKAARSRLREGWSKWPLRRAMNGIVPASILWRRDKIGFETPETEWISAWLAQDPTLFSDAMLARPYLDPAKVRACVASMKSGGGDARAIWRMMNLELWLRVWTRAQDAGTPVFDKATAAVGS